VGRALEKLVREAREDLGTSEAARVDWQAVDEALFARIEQDRGARRSRTPNRGRAWVVVAAMAAAAAIGIAVRGGHRPAPVAQGAPSSGDRESAEDAVSIEGEATVNGVSVSRAGAISLGDVIETGSAQVAMKRAGKVAVTLEHARVRVTQWREPLVLALELGAVEARVTHVDHGEAFAVDVEGSRVAVHGTHLRVELLPPRKVVVDLIEGVIAIGEAPRSGSVTGTVVRAPAHAEFMADRVLATLTTTGRDFAGSGAPSAAPSPAVGPSPAASPVASLSAPLSPHPGHGTPAAAPPSGAPKAPDLAAVVRGCMAERPHIENVTVLVSTTLYVTASEDGSVQSARFDPPVSPEVNACATPSIYRSRFEHGGTIAIPVDFKN
jgi:hypothetical protein